MSQTVNVSFTRHKLTEQQMAEIGSVQIDCTDLASKNIVSLAEAEEVFWQMARRIQAGTASVFTPVRIYGVFPTPLRHVLLNWTSYQPGRRNVRLYEAFNIQRSAEGQKPTFVHDSWLLTGEYYFPV